MNTNQVYIGIDFSPKSPAICIHYNGKYKWLSYCSKIEKPKKESNIQLEVSNLTDVNMKFQDDLLTGTDYSSNDIASIYNYRNNANKIVNMIINELNKIKFKYELYIGFEGYSFNSFSNSNNIIDIVAATTTLKNKIIDKLTDGLKLKINIDIIAPVTLKQFAGYSKFDKVDLFDIFISDYSYIKEKWSKEINNDNEKRVLKNKPSVFKLNYDDKDLKGEFHTYCLNLELNRSVKNIKVPKPIDDMIDSYFVCCWLKSRYS
jgi:hypothetical protein